MRAGRGLVRLSLGALAATVAACGGSPPPTPAPAQPPKPAAAPAPTQPAASAPKPPAGAGSPAATKVPEVAAPTRPKYDVKGRRDPFENLQARDEETSKKPGGFTIASTKLTGIVRGRVPLVLVETPEGMGYILKAGDTLGDGRLLEIGQDSATFQVTPKPGSPTNRVVLKITTD